MAGVPQASFYSPQSPLQSPAAATMSSNQIADPDLCFEADDLLVKGSPKMQRKCSEDETTDVGVRSRVKCKAMGQQQNGERLLRQDSEIGEKSKLPEHVLNLQHQLETVLEKTGATKRIHVKIAGGRCGGRKSNDIGYFSHIAEEKCRRNYPP